MKTIKNYLFFSFLSFFTIILISEDIEEIIVKGDWREAQLLEEDSSLVLLRNEIIESQPVKHFENLSYLVPNLNFAASQTFPNQRYWRKVWI